MTRDERGFTIAEVIVAILILSVGLLAVAGSSGAVTRMLAHGRRATGAATVVASTMDSLRRAANKTNPRCTTLISGSAILAGRVTETWTVTGSGQSRNVRVIVSYPKNRGTAIDSVYGILECL